MEVNRSLFLKIFILDSSFIGRHTLSETEIIEFGLKYAPVPYHTDPVAARNSSFGGLVAAGYQTAALTFGLFAKTGALAERYGLSRC